MHLPASLPLPSDLSCPGRGLGSTVFLNVISPCARCRQHARLGIHQTEPARASRSPSFLAIAFVLQCANASLHRGWHASHARHAEAIPCSLFCIKGQVALLWGWCSPPSLGQGALPSPRSPSFHCCSSPSDGSCPESTSPLQHKTHGSINAVAGFRF